MSGNISNDINGPFARSGWHATSEPQTETVYGVLVEYEDGHQEVWSVDVEPIPPLKITAWPRTWGTKEKPIRAASLVERTITISGTDWVASVTE